ncbi:uncharacterized protein LOC115442220 [Manduca sexta]|uniref:uncharacterized protein LOC115442220 n=1 Tax=Manduca sexta TaxID=7130 RepID=UPI0011831ACD|nr:uncharacterized protein LOC115442220 [Manduca sexta]
MKITLNTSKRKKIRTRKSLNEIRKRSRRLMHPDTKCNGTTGEMDNNQKNYNHSITTNRLTLQMFPNAVQSETVTRCRNRVKKKLNLNLKDLVPETKSYIINTEVVENDKCDNSENNVHNISENDEQKPDVNIALESPEVESELQRESDIAQVTEHDTHATTPSSDASDGHSTHDKYYLYEQFMSNLSGYLKQTVASSLLSEEVIENLKEHLLSIKIQSNNNIQLKHKATISNMHICNVSEDLMVEDPMDYIRLSYSAMQNSPSQQSECSTGTSDGVDSLLHMHSPQLMSSSSRTDISDTPEYIYFPHKLN